jgi:AcrR family transcriptional regulator
MQTRVNKRRAPGEGRVLLLRAAREVFSEVGYADATTRGIADRAGIAEALLFRNFGNKAALFEEAALGPFQDFIEDWRVEQRRRKSELPTAKPSAGNLRMMVGAFYDLLRNNRGLVLAYIATSHFTPDVVNFEESPIFLEAIDTLARWSQSDFLGPRLHSSRNLRIANRAIVGMILSMALFDEWLLNPAGETPSREEIIEEMTQIILHGVTH